MFNKYMKLFKFQLIDIIIHFFFWNKGATLDEQNHHKKISKEFYENIQKNKAQNTSHSYFFDQ